MTSSHHWTPHSEISILNVQKVFINMGDSVGSDVILQVLVIGAETMVMMRVTSIYLDFIGKICL